MITDRFTGSFQRILIPGTGHFSMRETPEKFATQLAIHSTTCQSSTFVMK
jgi:pimeloyl-ACP methyl ester carboxylesterase